MKPVRRRYHIRLAGILYVGVTLLLGVGALNSNNNLLYLIFGLGLAGLLVSGIISGAMLRGVRVRRVPPDAGAVDQRTTIGYSITNTKRFIPVFAVTITESSRRVAHGPRPRWSRLFPAPRAFVMHLGPRQTVRVPATIVPVHRGQALLSTIQVSTTFPFGIVRKSLVFAHPQMLDIHPRIAAVRSDVLTGAIGREYAGTGSQNRKGQGVEFHGLREYVPGDSWRHIAWRRTARLGDMVVREHLETSSGRLWIILDLNSSTGNSERDDTLTEQAISLAAGFATGALTRSIEVGLIAPEQGVVCAQAGGSRHRIQLLAALSKLQPAPAPLDRQISHSAQSHLLQRSPCVVIHAGDLDPSVGQAGARHIVTSQLDHLPSSTPTQPSGDLDSAERSATIGEVAP